MNNLAAIGIKLQDPDAIMPTRSSEYAAGLDLFLPKDTIINPGRQIVPLGFSIQLPLDIVGWITSRSGFASKGMVGNTLGQGVYDAPDVRFDADVIDGKVDPDYRGIVGVIIKSNEKVPFHLPKHTKIAQLVPLVFANNQLKVIQVDELTDTERGEGGFGSTGV